MIKNHPTTRSTSALGGLLSCIDVNSKPASASVVADEAKPNQLVSPNAYRILIVDDDAVVRKATEIKLKAQGYAVLSAADGPSAIQTARVERPDLILLDLSFPPDVSLSWDGFGIMAWLRRLENLKRTPIIICTGIEGRELARRAQAEGAAGFFRKPLDYDALLGMIRFRLKASRQTLPDSASDSSEI